MEARISNEFDQGFTWVVEEQMERASHALVHDGRVWLIDPVAWEPALERAAGLGEAAGVIQLLDRHDRDGVAVARRLGVPLTRLPEALVGSPFQPQRLIDRRWWREVVLWWPEAKLLVVPEAVGTAGYFTLGRPLGVHPMLRLTPPYSLRSYEPDHILVGHGPSLHTAASASLEIALHHARSDIVRGLTMLPGMLKRRG